MHEMMNPRGAILDITLHSRQQRLPVHNKQHAEYCSGIHEKTPVASRRNGMASKRTQRSVDSAETNRKVSFKGRVRILKIPGRSSFTKEEKESMWYTKEEMVELVDKRCDAVAMMIRDDDGKHPTKRGQDEYKVAVMPKRKGRTKSLRGTETSNESCTDGLRSRHEYKISKVVVQEALNEVLLEQEIQWKENVSDPEHLADVYFEYTRHNQRQAVERGRRLATEIEHENYGSSDATEENDGVGINFDKATPALPDRRSLQMLFASMDGALMEKYCLTKSRRKGMKGAERRRMILEEAMDMVSSTLPDDGACTVASSSCPCSQESQASCSATSSSSSTPSQTNTSRSSNSKWNDDASGDHTPRPPPRRR